MELPANSRALYRICTRKSRLGFGKYTDLYTVGDILKIDPVYLVWVYTACEKISFTQDILDELGLPKIVKPGVDKDLYFTWHRERSAGFTEEERMHGAVKKKAKERAKAIGRLMDAKKYTTFTKGQLQAINHGHKK